MFGGGKDLSDDETDDRKSELLRSLNQYNVPLYTYCMNFNFSDFDVHEEVYEVLSHVVNE